MTTFKLRRCLLKIFSLSVFFIPFSRMRKKARHKIKRVINTPTKREIKKTAKIQANDETLEIIIKNKLSIARYGDGEIGYLLDKNFKHFFQPMNLELQQRLKEILQNPIEQCMTAIPPWLNGNLARPEMVEQYWIKIYPYLNQNYTYASSFCFTVSSFIEGNISYMQKIWKDRRVLLVTGANSTFIWDKRLFEGADLIDIVYSKPIDAYSEYDNILHSIVNHKASDKETLILIALGLSATVLAYDLSKLGYQALDIGHISNYYLQYLGEMENIEVMRQKGIFKDGDDITKLLSNNL